MNRNICFSKCPMTTYVHFEVNIHDCCMYTLGETNAISWFLIVDTHKPLHMQSMWGDVKTMALQQGTLPWAVKCLAYGRLRLSVSTGPCWTWTSHPPDPEPSPCWLCLCPLYQSFPLTISVLTGAKQDQYDQQNIRTEHGNWQSTIIKQSCASFFNHNPGFIIVIMMIRVP